MEEDKNKIGSIISLSGINISFIMKSYLHNRRGNIGILFSVSLVPVLLCMGAVLDFGVAYNLKLKLQQAADSSAVGSLAKSAVAISESLAKGLDGEISAGQKDAKTLFAASLDDYTEKLVTSYDFSVSRGTDSFSSSVKFTAKVPTILMGLVGKDFIDIQGSAKATYTPEPFTDFYLLLDNSPSMGLGATADDISLLEKSTPGKCAFACHIEGSTSDNYAIAKNIGATIRIRLVVDAVQELMKSATKSSIYSDQIRFSVYSMGEKTTNIKLTNIKLTNIASMSSDFDEVSKQGEELDRMSTPYQGYNYDQMTDFELILGQIRNEIGKGGKVRDAKDRQKILFFVSDGVNDSYKPNDCSKASTKGRCRTPVDPALCKLIKESNVKVAVLYTTYHPVTSNRCYNTWIAPFQYEIGPKMKECASDGLFFEVSPSQKISSAMNALFLNAASYTRLSG